MAPSNQKAIDALKAQFGKNFIVKFDDCSDVGARIPTGLGAMDAALGGGIYEGSIVEVFGKESSGKSTMALMVAATAQKNGGSVLWLDYEHSFNPNYAKHIGLDLASDKFIMAQPHNAEEGLDTIGKVIETGGIKVIVVDSLAAMKPQRFIEGGPTEETYPLLPKMLSNALPMWLGPIDTKKMVLIFINHQKEKIGAFGFGDKTYTTGGVALKYYANIRVEIKLIKRLKKGDSVLGYAVKLETKKNRHFPPFRTADMEMIFGEGFKDISDGKSGKKKEDDTVQEEAVPDTEEPEERPAYGKKKPLSGDDAPLKVTFADSQK